MTSSLALRIVVERGDGTTGKAKVEHDLLMDAAFTHHARSVVKR